MNVSLKMARTLVVAGMVIVSGALAGAAHGTTAQARGVPSKMSCAVLGTYHIGSIGPRVTPEQPRTGAGVSPIAEQPSRAAIAIGPWILTGMLTISAYSGCGQSTSGAFTVQRSLLGPAIERPGTARTSIACVAGPPCGVPVTGVISATGSFAQDMTHPQDPTYVTVSATVVTARLGPQMGRPCSANTGCPAPTVIRSTVTFSNVTGYLQTTSDGQTATLSFLPPPAANSGQPPAVMALVATRGVRPLPNPAP
jgi:hypothetical protein